MGNKNHRILSVDSEKKETKHLMKSTFIYYKISQQSGIEGRYLNLLQAIYDTPTFNIILNSEKVKIFPLGSVTRPESPLILNRRSQGLGKFSLRRKRIGYV